MKNKKTNKKTLKLEKLDIAKINNLKQVYGGKMDDQSKISSCWFPC